MDQTVLAVPVAEAEHLVRTAAERYETELANVRADDRLAHITVLTPFLPIDGCTDAVLAKLRALFGRRRSFAFRLARVGVFPADVVYLAPTPPDGFVELTNE